MLSSFRGHCGVLKQFSASRFERNLTISKTADLFCHGKSYEVIQGDTVPTGKGGSHFSQRLGKA
jgi:hypothetical protein